MGNNIIKKREVFGLLVGGGAVGVDFHLPRMLNIAGCTSISIVDHSIERRKRLIKIFRHDARISICADIPKNEYALAVIATPPKHRLDILEKIIDNCESVIIEKPIALTVSEGQKILDLKNKHKSEVAICLIRRSLKGFNLIRRWKEEALFGKLKSVSVNEGNVFTWNAVSEGSFSQELNGGGVLMDTGPHVIDQMYQVFDDLDLVSAKMDALVNKQTKCIEANVYLELVADGATHLDISLSRNRSLSNSSLFIFENAKALVSMHSNDIKIISNKGNALCGIPDKSTDNISFPELFDEYYRNYVMKRKFDDVLIEVGLKPQMLIEKAYKIADVITEGF